MPTYKIVFPKVFADSRGLASNFVAVEASSPTAARQAVYRDTGIPFSALTATESTKKDTEDWPGVSGQPSRTPINPDAPALGPLSQAQMMAGQTKPSYADSNPFFALPSYAQQAMGQGEVASAIPTSAYRFSPSMKDVSSTGALGLLEIQRQIQNSQAQNAAGSYYGTADDPNAGQFSVVNPFAQGGRSTRGVGPLQTNGTTFTVDPITGNVNYEIGDSGDGGNGYSAPSNEVKVGGEEYLGYPSYGKTVSPDEGFLAVLSTIQNMADVAPGGLVDLNALLAAITADPSLYLIDESTPITDANGNTIYITQKVINPVIEQLLDLQETGQTNLSKIELERIVQTANVDMERIRGENEVNLAKENNPRMIAEAQYAVQSPYGLLSASGATTEEITALANSLARQGMSPQEAIRKALATTGGAYGALGGVADGYNVNDIATLARVQALPQLAALSPQSLGGLSAILGQEAVRGLFSPFTGQQQQPFTGQQQQPEIMGQRQQTGTIPSSFLASYGEKTMGEGETPTLGQYENLTPWDQGAVMANLSAQGKDPERAIRGVTLGTPYGRGALA